MMPTEQRRRAWYGWAAKGVPALLTGVLAGGAVFAALGMWQLTWAMEATSEAFQMPAPSDAEPSRPTPSEMPAPAAPRPVREDEAPQPSPGPAPSAVAPPPRLEDPLPIPEPSDYQSLARCENAFVYIVSVSPRSPEHSAASIAFGPTAPARFRRIGQSIGEWRVSAIVDGWSGLEPEVWLRRDEEMCRAELAGNPKRVIAADPPKPAPKKKKARKRRRRSK